MRVPLVRGGNRQPAYGFLDRRKGDDAGMTDISEWTRTSSARASTSPRTMVVRRSADYHARDDRSERSEQRKSVGEGGVAAVRWRFGAGLKGAGCLVPARTKQAPQTERPTGSNVRSAARLPRLRGAATGRAHRASPTRRGERPGAF
ncbi:hypothetical protein [Haladaptatus halobius]|uniref:hypothetical protein n=1 Tax=Haladaptatus halobius TaxID=2884875 RepID=UPI001D0B89CA|nr:hypothetical protein [Haladaptatus halobius]